MIKFASNGAGKSAVICPLQYYPSGAISVGTRHMSKTDEFLVGGIAEEIPRDRLRAGAAHVEIFAVNESSGEVQMGNEYDLLVGCPADAKGIRFKSIDCDRGACGAGPDFLSSEGWMHIWYRPWNKLQHLIGGTAHIKLTFVDRSRGDSKLVRAITVTVDPDGTSRLSPQLPSISLLCVPASAPRWRPAPLMIGPSQ